MNNIDEAKEYMDEHECNCLHCRQIRKQQAIEALLNPEAANEAARKREEK